MKPFVAFAFLLVFVTSCQYFEELDWKVLKKNVCLLMQKDGIAIEYAHNGQLKRAGTLTFEYSKGALSKIKVDAQQAYFDVVLDRPRKHHCDYSVSIGRQHLSATWQ